MARWLVTVFEDGHIENFYTDKVLSLSSFTAFEGVKIRVPEGLEPKRVKQIRMSLYNNELMLEQWQIDDVVATKEGEFLLCKGTFIQLEDSR